SDKQWEKNYCSKFMYFNRLRVDDYLHILQSLNQEIIGVEPEIDYDLLEALKSDRIELDKAFFSKPHEVLATICSWIISRKP
ncbi:MAG: hypothetical protein JW867_05845, partial [Candidatus Omnitrophica bacterium]|nr:hypothetical protein [Candidatus Omnitrophota bacterium]